MRRTLLPPSERIDLVKLSSTVSYIGSAEHKKYPSFAGQPRPRGDATLCDPSFRSALAIGTVLKLAMVAGRIGGPWEGDYPRYVWSQIDGDWYEGRLVNRVLGQYKGYRIEEWEVPSNWEQVE